jgi:hypothetical protein
MELFEREGLLYCINANPTKEKLNLEREAHN